MLLRCCHADAATPRWLALRRWQRGAALPLMLLRQICCRSIITLLR